MKITFEFNSIQDMLNQMPKFGQLITGDGPAEERIAMATADDPTPLIMKITPQDGIPFTEGEKEAIRATINQFIDTARTTKIEKVRAEVAAQIASDASPEPPKEKTKKNPPKAKEPEEKANPEPEQAPAAAATATETSARATLNGLVKSRGNAAVKLVFHALGVKNFGDLKEPSQYAEALTQADKVKAMTDEEFEAALKDAGIKGGRK